MVYDDLDGLRSSLLTANIRGSVQVIDKVGLGGLRRVILPIVVPKLPSDRALESPYWICHG
jgi:hypothetical protein